jgi:hypothetical protein
VAARREPQIENIPPLARIECAERMSLVTRDRRAYIEESGIKKVEMPAEERRVASSRPVYLQPIRDK